MKIPLFGLGIQGRSPNLSAQRRLNLYLEVMEDGDKASVSAHQTPGLMLVHDFGDDPIRGMHSIGASLYIVHRSTLWELVGGSVLSRGNIVSTSGRVSMADNGVELFIADGVSKGYVYTIASITLAAVVDADAPISDTAAFLDGSIVVSKTNSAQFWISDPYAAATFQSTSFATAESNPDLIVSVFADRGMLILYGEYTTEVWQNAGTSPVQFQRVQGATLEYGLAARWSVAKFEDSVVFLGRNRLGQVSIVRQSGMSAQPISPPDLDYLINNYSTTADASAFSYKLNGHSFYQINFGTAARSWLYDSKSGAWSELESNLITRHRAEIGIQSQGKSVTSDFLNGRLYQLSADIYTDNGDPIARELVSGHVYAVGYNSLFVSSLRIDAETGVGLVSGQGDNPQMMLQISRDGGHAWGEERWTSMGKIGEYLSRCEWRRLGAARDWIFKVRITDPVKVVFLGAEVEAMAGSA